MQLRWVNHASFVVESGGVHLLSDPWLSGRAFDDSWELLSETKFTAADFGEITHIWISHEHPDHFSPASLRSIPEELRSNIVLMSQVTRDRKVVDYCRSLGFADVRELPTREWVSLAPGVDVQCSPFPYDDSWLAVRTPDQLLLNVNDCLIGRADIPDILESIGRRPDVLVTQFSYASWVGNPDDVTAHRRAAQQSLGRFSDHVVGFAPRYVIPAASYVWFCHEENRYMNRSANEPADAVACVGSPTVPVVLYPGDCWDVDSEAPTQRSLEQYRSDYVSASNREPVHSAPIAMEGLRAAGDKYRARLFEQNGLSLRMLSMTGRVAPTHVWLTDHGESVRFSLTRGLAASQREHDDCDVALSSAALAYMLNNPWGGMTLIINGRYSQPARGDFERFGRYVRLGDSANHGRTLWMAVAARAAAIVPFGEPFLRHLAGE
jgi:hypothetical protein